MILDKQNQRMMMMSKKASSFDQTKSSTLIGEQSAQLSSQPSPPTTPPTTKLANLASSTNSLINSSPPTPQSYLMVLNKKATPIMEPRFDPNGLVLPKKLPNPSLESREKKEIHREMLWKLKNNGGVANQDPKQTNEYKKVYQKYQQRLREKERQESNESVSFERMLEEHKQRLNSVHTGSLDSATADDNGHHHQPHPHPHLHHHHHHHSTNRDSMIDPSSMDGGHTGPAQDNHHHGDQEHQEDSYKKIFTRLRSTGSNKLLSQQHSHDGVQSSTVHDSNNNNHNHNDKNSKLFATPPIHASAAAAVSAPGKN